MTELIKRITVLVLCLAASSGLALAEERTDTTRDKTADAMATSRGDGTKDKTALCAVNCVDPDISADSESVINVIKAITKALAAHDYAAMTACMDANCTTYDENTHKLVVGRDNIVADVKAKVAAEEAKLKVPAISYTIDHPYAIVTGNQAVVTFVLVKEIGGAHPMKLESHCSDVFIKKDGEWKKLHFCGEGWKDLK